MPDVVLAICVLVAAYLLGQFPTALVVGRRLGFDPIGSGSGNPGASNSFRVGGRTAGVLVLLGDVLKGVLATGLGLLVGGRALALGAGLAAVVGHVAPVTRRFRGGKGVATAAGVVLVLYPVVLLGMAVVWGVVVKLTGKASLASLLVIVGMVPAVALLGRPAWEVAMVAVLAAVVVARHWTNLVRLVQGTERPIRGVQPG
jgi:glycerol-3-phosphate acyltransferase PlsY